MAGSKACRWIDTFCWQVGDTPNGEEQKDRSSIGLVFAKKPPEREAITNILWKRRLKIPAGDPYFRGQASYTMPANAQILSFMPHMHYRGVRAHYKARYPDGREETLLSVPYYDFNWQSVFRFEQPISVPKGTTVTFTGWWDNSADNPHNPNPKRVVPWGEQTWDEMLNGWLEYVVSDSGASD